MTHVLGGLVRMVRRPGRLPTPADRHGRALPRNGATTPGTCGTPPRVGPTPTAESRAARSCADGFSSARAGTMGVMSSDDLVDRSLPAVQAARAALVREFRWHMGHADVWRVFSQAATLALVVEGLADPWRDAGVTHVLGVESRGFLLGAAVAVNLGVGFQAVRKGDGMLPGPKLSTVSSPDYRGQEHLIRMQQLLGPGDVGLLVDDWAERGAQASAVRELVALSGARLRAFHSWWTS